MQKQSKRFIGALLTLALILSLIPAFTITASAAGTIHYVNGTGGSDGNDGDTWGTAFASLQQAIDRASDGDTIFVAKGTYNQTAEYLLTSKDIKIYGSFDGTESSPDERTFASENTSVLDAAAVSRVFSLNGRSNATVIDGFKITGGYGDDGAGIRNGNSSPVLANLTISGNTASDRGGGMNNNNSSPVLTNVTISGNSANGDGGGMYNFASSSPKLYNSIVLGNNAAADDGVSNDDSGGTNNPEYNHSLVEGVTTADANGNTDGIAITAAMIFTNPATDDYTLATNSPAIGAGSTDYWTVNTHTQLGGKTIFNYLGGDWAAITDLAGNERNKGIIDLGAYESDYFAVRFDTDGGLPIPDTQYVAFTTTKTTYKADPDGSFYKAEGEDEYLPVGDGKLYAATDVSVYKVIPPMPADKYVYRRTATSTRVEYESIGDLAGGKISDDATPYVDTHDKLWFMYANKQLIEPFGGVEYDADDLYVRINSGSGSGAIASVDRRFEKIKVNSLVTTAEIGLTFTEIPSSEVSAHTEAFYLKTEGRYVQIENLEKYKAVPTDESVSEPNPAPTKAGFTFSGWYDGITLWDFTAPVTTDTTLTAQWRQNNPNPGPSVNNSAIDPKTAAPVRNSGGGHADLAITLTANGNTLNNLTFGGKNLVRGEDYTVSGSTITIKGAFLDALATGTHTIVFDMNAVTDPTLALTIS